MSYKDPFDPGVQGCLRTRTQRHSLATGVSWVSCVLSTGFLKHIEIPCFRPSTNKLSSMLLESFFGLVVFQIRFARAVKWKPVVSPDDSRHLSWL